MEPTTPAPAPGSSVRTVSWTAETALVQAPDLAGPREDLGSWSRLGDLTPAACSLVVVAVPAPAEDQPAQAGAAREALLARHDIPATAVTLLGLQGAHLVSAPGWIVVLAAEDRLEVAVEAAVTACITDAELRRVETSLASSWGPLRSLAPAAFEPTPATLAGRAQLQEAYGALLELRETTTRLGPRVMVPHVYPPTLASQVGERLRERLRMYERFELLEPTLLAQEQVHGLVAERVGETLNARKGHALEWTIILLLGAEVVLLLFDMMVSSAG